MDKKTFAQFLIFCSAVLGAWWVASYIWFRPEPAAPRPPEAAPAVIAAAEAPEGRSPRALQGTEGPAAAVPDEPVPEPATALLDNGMIRTEWTNRGGALARLDLLDERYRAPYEVGGERPVLTLLRDFQDGLCSDVLESLTFYVADPQGGERVLEFPVGDRLYELAREPGGRLAFSTVVRDPHGHAVEVRKTVTAEPGAHHYKVDLEFRNAAEAPCKFAFALRGPAGIERESLATGNLGTRVGLSERRDSYSVKKTSTGDLSKGQRVNESADIAWAAVVNHYFVAVLNPEDAAWVNRVVSRSIIDSDLLAGRGRWPVGSIRREADRARLAAQNAAIVLHSTAQKLEPGQTLLIRYALVAAPKEPALLESYDRGFGKLIEYGILPGVSKLVVALLKAVYRVLPNYGVALILMTIIVRALLHPLTRKSQIGMAKMQKLQPMLEELQKKCGDDKQRLTQEQMELWRKYGVSPMGGCLPLLLQMPVLFALFGALRAAIELRHAGFLWVEDLSRSDTLFTFKFFLPIVQNEFNLLPLLMAVVMVVTQKSAMQASTEQARQQQKMMKFMPVIFAVFLYSMPSGLCLYILTSTLVGTFERWLVQRHTDTIELRPVGESPRKGKPTRPGTRPAGRPSGWMGRLQKMVEEQGKPGPQPRRRPKKK